MTEKKRVLCLLLVVICLRGHAYGATTEKKSAAGQDTVAGELGLRRPQRGIFGRNVLVGAEASNSGKETTSSAGKIVRATDAKPSPVLSGGKISSAVNQQAVETATSAAENTVSLPGSAADTGAPAAARKDAGTTRSDTTLPADGAVAIPKGLIPSGIRPAIKAAVAVPRPTVQAEGGSPASTSVVRGNSGPMATGSAMAKKVALAGGRGKKSTATESNGGVDATNNSSKKDATADSSSLFSTNSAYIKRTANKEALAVAPTPAAGDAGSGILPATAPAASNFSDNSAYMKAEQRRNASKQAAGTSPTLTK